MKGGYWVNFPIRATTTTVQTLIMARNTQLGKQKHYIITVVNGGHVFVIQAEGEHTVPERVVLTVKHRREGVMSGGDLVKMESTLNQHGYNSILQQHAILCGLTCAHNHQIWIQLRSFRLSWTGERKKKQPAYVFCQILYLVFNIILFFFSISAG